MGRVFERKQAGLLGSCRWLIAVLCLSATGCSGGGGGSGGGGVTSTTTSPTTSGGPTALPATAPPPAPEPGSPSGPSDAEINRNYGLDAINARAAYTAGATGDNVKVAIIDSGIDVNHPEFSGRIDPRSTDVVSGSRATLDDTNGHGTHVAGIIAAAADRSGVVGVAPEATILALRANDRGPGVGNDLLFFDEDVAAALNRAVSEGAKVINMSFGKLDSISSEYEDALARAVANDVLIVAAAGNQGSEDSETPANLAGTGFARGKILAVGAVDEDDRTASFSNEPGPGSLQDSFLVAPGVDIRSTAAGGGLGTRSGTSFATPHVSGAAAALKSAFPSLSMAQIADLLLRTARDLGPEGTDTIYGRGIIDLEAALAPQGSMSIASGASINGERALVADTQLSLGAAFGDALSSSASLKSVMALDDYDRPYSIDISNSVVQSEPSFGLDDLLIDNRRHNATDLPGSLGRSQAGLAWQSDDSRLWDRGTTGFRQEEENDTQLNRFDLSGSNEVTSWRMGYGLAPGSMLTSAPVEQQSGGLFWQTQSLTMPETGLIDRGVGGAMRHRLADDTDLVFGMMQTADVDEQDEDTDQGDAQLFHLGVDHQATERMRLGLGFSHIGEDEAFLGSSSDGAFGDDASASTQMMTLRGDLDVGRGFNLFASGTVAQTAVGGDQGMLQDWSNVQSQAFAMGVTKSGIFGETDRLGLVIGQPLRVSSAEATLSVPTARELDGDVIHSEGRVDVSPEGREINMQLSYQTDLSERFTLGSWLMFRNEPGHDADAENDYAVGLRLDRRF